MVTVNASLQALAAHSKAGWRASDALTTTSSRSTFATSRAASSSRSRDASPSTSLIKSEPRQATREQISATASSCGAALAELRRLIRQKSIASKATDIEKAAGNMVSTLVEMELFDVALRELANMHASIISWFDASVSLSQAVLLGAEDGKHVPPSTFASLYSVPCPVADKVDTQGMPLNHLVSDIIPLVMAMQQYVIVCLFRSTSTDADLCKRIVKLQHATKTGGTAVDWSILLAKCLNENRDMQEQGLVSLRKADAVLTSIFATITKGCVGADTHTNPQTLLDIRTHALFAFAHTRALYTAPAKIDSFLEQTRKVLLLYGRQAEQRGIGNALVNASVKVAFEGITRMLDHKGANKTGKMWTALCEVIQHIASRADDLAAVDRISLLLGDDNSAQIASPEERVDLLCAKLTSSMSFLEAFFKNGKDDGVCDQAQRAVSLLIALSPLRTDVAARPTWTKIDKVAERLRYVVARHIRGSKRLDQLVMDSGEDTRKRSPTDDALLALLDGALRLYEAISREFVRSEVPVSAGVHLFDSAVETSVMLAYSRLVVNSRQSYAKVAETLERAQTFVILRSAESNLDPAACLSVKSLASTWFNIGGILYNSAKPEHAIRFVQRSCDLTNAGIKLYGVSDLAGDMEKMTIQDDNPGNREGHADVVDELRRQATKRWELLGMCRHTIGDKKVRPSASVLGFRLAEYLIPKQLALAAFEHAIFAACVVDAKALEDTTESTSPTQLSEQFPTLFRLIQRSSKLATFELLHDPSDIGIAPRMIAHAVAAESAALLMELQILSLKSHMDRSEAHAAIVTIIQQLLGQYPATVAPLRRARVLLWQLQFGFATEDSAFRQAYCAADEVRKLCEQISANGYPVASQISRQYSALSHLWSAICALRSPAQHSIVADEATKALQVIQGCLPFKEPHTATSTESHGQVPPKAAEPARTTTSKSSIKPTVLTSGRRARSTRTKPELTAPSSTASADKTPQSRKALSRTIPKTTPPRKIAFSTLERDQVALHPAERQPFVDLDDLVEALPFVQCSTQLAIEYMKLDKLESAQAVLDQATACAAEIKDDPSAIAAHVQVEMLLAKSTLLAANGQVGPSEQNYDAALTLADMIESEDTHPSVSIRVQGRTRVLQRAASAATTCSLILQQKGDLVRSLDPAMQSMRLWTRALSNINRLATRLNKKAEANGTEDAADAFDCGLRDMQAPRTEFQTTTRKKLPILNGGIHATMAWRLVECTGMAILRVARLNSTRGIPKAAEHYSSAALDFAQDVASVRLEAQALALRAEVRMKLGRLADAQSDLESIRCLGQDHVSVEKVLLHQLQGELCARQGALVEANEQLGSAFIALEEYEQIAALHLSLPLQSNTGVRPPLTASTRYSTLTSSTSQRCGVESLVASQHAALLRTQLRVDGLETSRRGLLLDRLSKVSLADVDKAAENLVRAITIFDDLIARFASDPTLGILPDSVVSLPAFCSAASTSVRLSLPKGGHDSYVASVREIDTLLQGALDWAASRADPAQIRQICLLASTLQSFKHCVSRALKGSSANVGHFLDLSMAIALRRDMLEVVENKLSDTGSHDDLIWPVIVPRPRKIGMDKADVAHWQWLRNRYQIQASEMPVEQSRIQDVLPQAWTAVSVHLSADRDCLILARYTRGNEPIIVRAPLDRMARREGEEESMTYESAINELRDIITASNRGAQDAKNVDGKEARAAWWAERKELDSRLQELLLAVENDWLAAFKSVFLTRRFDHASFDDFVTRIEGILKRSIVRAAQDKRASRFKLDRGLLDCLSALPFSSREEDFEDVYHFIMESFQLIGIPAACDEVDVDQIVLDLRSAFEDLQGPDAVEQDGQHLLLMLDKSMQALPWESLPCLRGKSVSRVPSLSFVKDRLDLLEARAKETGRLVVDTSRTSFILNPSKDLTNTQKTFEPWLEHQRRHSGWTGITGRAPSDEEVKHSLSTSDLVLYFGHGGAEQYVRSQTIRNLSQCATTMLWGCSSGTLKSQGDFELTGTPYHYLVGGCPALVANLWDVTDKDIDKFAVSVFGHLGLWSDTLVKAEQKTRAKISLTDAVARSRDVPMLRYLNGAAPVVYGIPVWFA
ncbi:separin protein [Microbotryomycetes sp. JL201]|nr:separin protein [Microbotryomycetes sp. JL201]